jgi:hypothetical protein
VAFVPRAPASPPAAGGDERGADDDGEVEGGDGGVGLVTDAPLTSPEFAEALRAFWKDVVAGQ